MSLLVDRGGDATETAILRIITCSNRAAHTMTASDHVHFATGVSGEGSVFRYKNLPSEKPCWGSQMKCRPNEVHTWLVLFLIGLTQGYTSARCPDLHAQLMHGPKLVFSVDAMPVITITTHP